MAKIIDVTLATIRNVGPTAASPRGVIRCATVRAVNDEEVHQVEALYLRMQPGQPMHPSGAMFIAPGQGLSYNVTKRLTIHHGDPGHLDEMLMFSSDLKQDIVDDTGHVLPDQIYQGSFNRKLRYEEIDGFNAVSCDYSIIHQAEVRVKIIAAFTVSLISG